MRDKVRREKKAQEVSPGDIPKIRARTPNESEWATVVLSGGAPNSPLMAGALAAIWDRGKTFNSFYTSGAGATIALLFLASKEDNVSKVLKDTLSAGISDEIYNWYPFPYKAFFKKGPFTVPWMAAAEMMHWPGSTSQPEDWPRRLYNDWVDMMTTLWTPTDTNLWSEGFNTHFPFLRPILDLDKLGKFNGHFYMNVYCIDDHEMQQFTQEHITVEHFYAALSYPCVYPPHKVHGKWYFEGSSKDPLNLPSLYKHVRGNTIHAETLVLVDLLGSMEDSLIRRPRNLMDALSISILQPIISLAQKELEHFIRHELQVQEKDVEKFMKREIDDLIVMLPEDKVRGFLNREDLYIKRLSFDIPKDARPYLADWSYSNMSELWKIGYKTGEDFVAAHGPYLPDRDGSSSNFVPQKGIDPDQEPTP